MFLFTKESDRSHSVYVYTPVPDYIQACRITGHHWIRVQHQQRPTLVQVNGEVAITLASVDQIASAGKDRRSV